MEKFTSPFFAEDISEPHSDYWLARRKVAEAMRELIEASTVSDIAAEDADDIAADLHRISSRLRQYRQLHGVVAYAKAHGNFPVANHEILCVGGASHPIAPGLRHWNDGELVKGAVTFDWAYEGPPGHVHGGWVAAVLDHFMGMAHMRTGKPGMTGGLDIRYRRPTPINTALDLEATITPIGDRKTRVVATMHCEGTLTVSAEALFVQPKHNIFKDGSTAQD